jgi:WD40 repeat protein
MNVTTVPPSLYVFGARPFQTDGELLALGFRPDGTLWSLEEPGILRHWDLAGARQIAWHNLDTPATLWAFSPHADLLGAGSDDLALWEVASGRLLASWGQPSWVTALTFGPPSGAEGAEGNPLVATGHDDHVVRLWNARQAQLIRELRGHDEAISALAFSHDGKVLASAGEDKIIRLWDVETGELSGTLVGHTDRIPALAWTPDDTRLLSAGWDTTVRVWDVSRCEPIILLNSHAAQVHALAVSGDGRWVGCADSANVVHIWDTARWKTLAVLRHHGGPIGALAISPDGRRLASGGAERCIHFWETNQAEAPEEPAEPLLARTLLAVSGDGGKLLSLGAGTPLRVWDTRTGKALWGLEGGPGLRAFAASADGRWIAGSRAVEDEDERNPPRDTLVLWDGATGKRLRTLEGQRAPITALAFSSSGDKLASAGFRGSDVWLWDIPAGTASLILPDATEDCSVETLAWQPGGPLLAVAGVDWFAPGGVAGMVALWHPEQRRLVRSTPGGALSLAFSPDGTRLAAASLVNAVRIYDVKSGELALELVGHTDTLHAVCFSPDGRWLASGGDDRVVRLWDAATGEDVGQEAVDTQVKALAFSPDGGSLFTGNGNTSCYRIDLAKYAMGGASHMDS